MFSEVIIQLNGEPRELPEGWTVATLVNDLGRDVRTVAVELNRKILPRSGYAETALSESDRLEIVHFVQGG